MPTYRIAQRTSNATSGQSAHTINASTNQIILTEAKVFMGAATASTYGIGRPAAAGITPGTQALFQADNPGSQASITNGTLTWTTSPTSPTVAMERWASPATVGTGVIWTFPKGIIVAASANFVLQNLATNGVVDSGFVIEE